VFVATIAAWLPRLFRVVTATKLINRHLSWFQANQRYKQLL
jgi:hypothetical protein